MALSLAFSSADWIPWITGFVNGSSCVAYAAVFGRFDAGIFLTHPENRSPWCGAVACWAKNRYLKPRLNIDGEPPAGSTYTILNRSATAEAGRFSSDENVPSRRSTLSSVIRRV